MKQLFFKTIAISLCAIALSACTTKEVYDALDLEGEKGQIFTLTATNGSSLETKLTFDQDGLGTTWQPGDKLYLIKTTDSNSITEMTTSIKEPAKTADFVSSKAVAIGEYLVLYGSQNISTTSTHRYALTLSGLNSKLLLYGTLVVTDGQKSANIILSHALAKLSFTLKNLPTNFSYFGMATPKELSSKFDFKLEETVNGKIEPYSTKGTWMWNLATKSEIQAGSQLGYYQGYAMIAPVDLSGKNAYFYIVGEQNNKIVVYEIAKEGKNLKAGVNYNITLDFATATITTLEKSNIHTSAYKLNTPTDFRAAAAFSELYNSRDYSVEADVNFENEDYFPIYGYLFGNEHTLSNINVSLKSTDYVGVVSKGGADNLTITNSSFEGKDCVGCCVGYFNNSSTSSLKLKANNVTIKGNDYVGGIIGDININRSLDGMTLLGTSSIIGNERVGGIYGYTNSGYTNSNFIVKGEISVVGTNYVGGICGYSYNNHTQCGAECNVTATGNYVGGIGGYHTSSIYLSYSKGNVTGANYVGGISGNSSCDNSYHIGDVTGTGSYVGGISGSSSNCSKCYSYGNVSSGYGISTSLSNYSTNLTSMSKLSDNHSEATYCNCGPNKTFLSKRDIINGDNYYSTECWEGIDAMCPLLTWQLDNEHIIPSPGFDDDDW